MNKQALVIKTGVEISSLTSQLNPRNQSYVLNSINALLFAQQVNSYGELRLPDNIGEPQNSKNQEVESYEK